MIVVAVATDDQGWFRALKASCVRSGLPLVVLGWGTTWTGFLHKPQIVERFLRSRPPDEMVLVVDAFDVLVLQGEEELFKRYSVLTRRSGSVVVGVDNRDGPWWIQWYVRKIFPSSVEHVLNAGVFFGPAVDIHRVYDILLKTKVVGDDQTRLNTMALKMKHLLTIDDSGYIIHTATIGRPPFLPMGSALPCVVHAPNPPHRWLDVERANRRRRNWRSGCLVCSVSISIGKASQPTQHGSDQDVTRAQPWMRDRFSRYVDRRYCINYNIVRDKIFNFLYKRHTRVMRMTKSQMESSSDINSDHCVFFFASCDFDHAMIIYIKVKTIHQEQTHSEWPVDVTEFKRSSLTSKRSRPRSMDW